MLESIRAKLSGMRVFASAAEEVMGAFNDELKERDLILREALNANAQYVTALAERDAEIERLKSLLRDLDVDLGIDG